jgi:hypothetical protein
MCVNLVAILVFLFIYLCLGQHNFDLVHCDLWTSVASISGYKYYLVILDDCSHYVWTFLSLTPF